MLLYEIILALLAAGGLVSLLWLVLGQLLLPAGGKLALVLAPAGDGAGLEQTLKALRWLISAELLRPCSILVVEDGLSLMGRTAALALCRRWQEVELCSAGELAERTKSLQE